MLPYSLTGKGIGGAIKHRVSDFKVEEITPSGEACKIRAFAEGKEKKSIEKQWPENPKGNEFLILEFEKFDYDLNQAIRLFSRWAHASRKRIGFAGLKDKRGITCQRISVWKPEYERVKEFKSRFVDARFLEWSSRRVEIGDLEGNRFEITVRGIVLEEEECREKIIEFGKIASEKGVANFFGEQRFGGARKITHVVGKELLKGNIKKAVMDYLCAESEREKEEATSARRNLRETSDFGLALKEFPKRMRFERAMCEHLHKNPNDFAGAIASMPKSMRYLFTHSFQAHLFNKMLAKRIERIGLGAIEEDTLLDGEPAMQLLGFDSEFSKGKLGEIEKEALEEEGFSLAEFKSKKIAELSSKGAWKKIVLKPKDFELVGIEGDEFSEGRLKAALRFGLEKGAYATTVMRELMKND